MSLETMTVRSVWCPKCRGAVVGETLTDGVDVLRCVSCGYRAVVADRADRTSPAPDRLRLHPRPDGFPTAPKRMKTCATCQGSFWPVRGSQRSCEVCRA